jgi:hypothetical protein
MKTALLVAALVLSASSAFAGMYHDAPSGGSSPAAASSATAAQKQAQGQAQHQGQSQTARGGNATGGNATGGRGGSSNVSINNAPTSGSGGGGDSYNGGVALTVPGGYGNAPCGGGVGMGGLGLGGGGSGGGTLWEFGDCKRMRESSALLQLGYPDAALAELCQIDRVREAFGGKCPEPKKAHLVLDTDAAKWDYCFTRNAGDRNQHRECDRLRAERN